LPYKLLCYIVLSFAVVANNWKTFPMRSQISRQQIITALTTFHLKLVPRELNYLKHVRRKGPVISQLT
jgi:hypothetical protein